MAQEQKELTGVLFRNKKKEKETQPGYQGKAMINGQLFWVSGWVNEPKGGGDKFVSLTFKSAEQNTTAAPGKKEKFSSEDSDDLPF